jgi:hypothetical protein
MQLRISARTLGGPVNGEAIQVAGVAAFCRRTVSAEDVRHLSRSVLYRSDVRSPCTGGSYEEAHPLTPSSRTGIIRQAGNVRMWSMVESCVRVR